MRLPSFTMEGFGVRDVIIDVTPDDYGDGIRIRVRMMAACDAGKPLPQTPFAQRCMLFGDYSLPGWLYDKGLGDAQLHKRIADIVRSQVARLVLHEVDEWLQCNGVLVTDPHPELRHTATVSVTLSAADLAGVGGGGGTTPILGKTG